MTALRRLPAMLALVAAVGAFWSCKEETRSFVPNVSADSGVPTMTTTNVETFISDSGYTRYHITAPLWQIFDESEEPYWRFPDGILLTQFDERLRPAADMECDSATYFSRRRLWRLDGHVVMVNTARDSFITSQLFWDQARATVYSDSFIHIVRSDRIIEGYGFESNQNMTRYTVNRPTGIIPVERKPDTATVAPDTAPAPEWDNSGRRPAPERASARNARRELDAGNVSPQFTPAPVRTRPRSGN